MNPPFLLCLSGGVWTAWRIPGDETDEKVWECLRSIRLVGRNWVWLKGGAVWPVHPLLPPLTPLGDPGLPSANPGSRCPTCLWARSGVRRCLCTFIQRCSRCGLPEGHPLEDLAGLSQSRFKPSPIFRGMVHRCVPWSRVRTRSLDAYGNSFPAI